MEQSEQKHHALFVGCAKAATAQDLNVAPNRTNFETVREAIDDQAQDFNVENVMAMLFRGGLALAPERARFELRVEKLMSNEAAVIEEIQKRLETIWRHEGLRDPWSGRRHYGGRGQCSAAGAS